MKLLFSFIKDLLNLQKCNFVFAYSYKNSYLANTKNFFLKPYEFLVKNIVIIHKDNRSKFHKDFNTTTKKLVLKHIFSKIRKSTKNVKN